MGTKHEDPSKDLRSRIFIKLHDYRLIIMSLFLSAGILFYVQFSEEQVYQIFIASHYLAFHTMAESATIVMYLASFLIIYYVGERDERLRMKVLAGAFLFVGCVDFWHTLSHYGMPGLLVPGSVQTAAAFWIIGRLGFAGGILASVFIPVKVKAPAASRWLMAGLPLVLAAGVLIYVSYFPDGFPTLFIEGQGLTATKLGVEYLIILMLFAAFLKLFIGYAHNKSRARALFISAIIISIFSEMAYISRFSVYDTYNILVHIYKLIAAYMIFRVLFILNINHSYESLDQAKEEISNYASGLEQLVEERTEEINQFNQDLIKDMEYAKTIQKAIMPGKYQSCGNLEVYSEYIPCEKVGGDYYGFEELSDEYLAFYIGDVAGHGIPAAMMTVFMKQTIIAEKVYQSRQNEIYAPKEVMTNLYNRYNETDFPTEMYALMIYGTFNKKTKEMVYSSAGLNTYPLLYEGHGRVQALKHKGFPICKFAKHYQPEYNDYAVRMYEGNKVLFYTDGIIEAKNTKGESFGEDRLTEIFGEVGDMTPEAISREILDALNEFIEDVKLDDDVHYFIMEVK